MLESRPSNSWWLVLTCVASSCGAPYTAEPPSPTGCPSNTIRVTDGSCALRCSTNADCGSGCCATLSNATSVAQACMPASSCPPGGGSGGGGGSTLTCSSPAAPGTCNQAGQLWCGNNRCCPSTNPLWWNGSCYGSSLQAAQAGATSSSCVQCTTPSTGAGGGTGGGGGGSPAQCSAFDRTSCLTATAVNTGQRGFCGGQGVNDMRVTLQNNCSEAVFWTICIDSPNGRCSCGSGTVRGGRSDSFFGCASPGRYRYFGVQDVALPSGCRSTISECR